MLISSITFCVLLYLGLALLNLIFVLNIVEGLAKGDILNGELKGALCQICFPYDKERPHKYRFDKKTSFKYYFEQCIPCIDLLLGSLFRPYLRNLKTRKST